jgi:hypothetical protein
VPKRVKNFIAMADHETVLKRLETYLKNSKNGSSIEIVKDLGGFKVVSTLRPVAQGQTLEEAIEAFLKRSEG